MRYHDEADVASRSLCRYGAGYWYRGGKVQHYGSDGNQLDNAIVQVYEADRLVAVLSSDTADSHLSRLRFELTPTGCGSIELDVTGLPAGVTITHNTRLDVILGSVPNPQWNHRYKGWVPPIYSGYVQQVPSSGSTDWPRKVKGFGWYGLLDKLTLNRTFTTAPVWRIVDTLSRALETLTNGRVLYNAGKIQVGRFGAGSSFPVAEIRFSHVTYRAALAQLAGLAGGYEFGVDAMREIWFREPITDPSADAHLWVGPHVHTVTYTEDSTDLVNRLWIKSGKRQAAGDNYLPLPLDADGMTSSQVQYGLREGEVTAPSVFDEVDAYRWGATQLAAKSSPKKTISISEVDGRAHFPADCSGPVRLTLDNGVSVTVPKAKVVYTIDKGVSCVIQLGEVTPNPGRLSAELQAQQARAELLQQLTMTQV